MSVIFLFVSGVLFAAGFVAIPCVKGDSNIPALLWIASGVFAIAGSL